MKTILCLLFLSAFTLTAAELTGKWTGSFDVTNSEGQTKADSAYMDLKLDGNVVTGTAGPDESKQMAIKDGKLYGRKLTFNVVMEDGGNITFDLVFDGETITGSALGTGENGEKMSAKLSLKRAA